MPRALITGITGQDGSYLTELLLAKGYEVHGVVRPMQSLDRSRLSHLVSDANILGTRLLLHEARLEDPMTLQRILWNTAPDEFYHLAGMSHVGQSFDMPEATCETTGMGALRLLEMVRGVPKPPRFFHASSSEIFGWPETAPQDERTPFRPVTPYGCAKAFATQLVSIYRETYKLFACNGIMYNHESPRRGENFVTQKICRAAAAIKQGKQRELHLGSLTARRDWGHACEYVRGMWLMLQQNVPSDYVLATGELHSVQEVVEIAFGVAGLDWRQYLVQDKKFIRPAEPGQLVGNPRKAKDKLQWQPAGTFEELITEMTRAALDEKSTPLPSRG
ncbi:MAG TPA: GDP-mannose 4,6-dehydratase [Verrucomicrobiae bacterium]|nr:GDP-mannose 4,6-dehydratase [Verrucomicrobiae bacterium]